MMTQTKQPAGCFAGAPFDQANGRSARPSSIGPLARNLAQTVAAEFRRLAFPLGRHENPRVAYNATASAVASAG
jgi:hypothetical protein